ncbi:acyltransferase family protein [Hirschia baltica]|uniref:Acyltransferase 3 n=1 Tax=Hirschia baltica (strain ATCC 49814 / DSM 5838 / IFAM 1418) TaxID=582402 RepID=C6XRJ5_HIRBI|nr:acyltransferase [Hirschia baltica]ACT58827.1 acyltransferase 3 [Hirschia baltica ATCC 49814]
MAFKISFASPTTIAPSTFGAFKIDSLQILRAVAALSVFFFHFFDAMNNDFGLFSGNVFSVGAFGVDVFFVVSGFIICFAAEKETSPISFFIKRLCRILPLYYLLTFGVFLIAIVAPFLLNSTSADIPNLLKSLFFIPYAKENGLVQPLLFLGWTLNYEMFFYVIFAISMIAGRFKIYVCIAIISLLILAGYVTKPTSTIAQFYTSGIMLNFIWGAVSYLIFRHFPNVCKALQPFWPLAAIAILAQNFVQLPLNREFAFGLPAAMLLLGVVTIKVPNGKVWSFSQLLGDASYSLYLVHPYILQVIIKVLIPLVGINIVSISTATVMSIAVTFLASILLFKWIEKPSNTFLRSIALKKTMRAGGLSVKLSS